MFEDGQDFGNKVLTFKLVWLVYVVQQPIRPLFDHPDMKNHLGFL